MDPMDHVDLMGLMELMGPLDLMGIMERMDPMRLKGVKVIGSTEDGEDGQERRC